MPRTYDIPSDRLAEYFHRHPASLRYGAGRYSVWQRIARRFDWWVRR
jgi:hypothetical protein